MDHYSTICTTVVSVFILLTVPSGVTGDISSSKMFTNEEDPLFNMTDCGKNLDIYKPNTIGEWQRKIMDARYEVTTHDRDMSLKITWGADITNVTGFKILLKPSGKDDICRILEYTDNPPPGVYWFNFTLNHIYPNVNYRAELSPLPNQDNSITLISEFNSLDCSMFSPSFTSNYDGRYLNVNFTKGPDECQYQRYEVAVHRNTSGNIVAKVVVPTKRNVVQLQATLEPDICKGYYFLRVGVHRNENDSCPCKDRQQRCRSCTYGRSTPKYFIPARSCPQKSATPEKPKENYKLFSYLGIILGSLLLISLALSITYRKLC